MDDKMILIGDSGISGSMVRAMIEAQNQNTGAEIIVINQQAPGSMDLKPIVIEQMKNAHDLIIPHQKFPKGAKRSVKHHNKKYNSKDKRTRKNKLAKKARKNNR